MCLEVRANLLRLQAPTCNTKQHQGRPEDPVPLTTGEEFESSRIPEPRKSQYRMEHRVMCMSRATFETSRIT